MRQSDTGQDAITQWILETYPRDAAIILYEAVLDGRLAVPLEEMLPLPPDSAVLEAYKEARAILGLARDQLYYTLLTAVQGETEPC